MTEHRTRQPLMESWLRYLWDWGMIAGWSETDSEEYRIKMKRPTLTWLLCAVFHLAIFLPVEYAYALLTTTIYYLIGVYRIIVELSRVFKNWEPK